MKTILYATDCTNNDASALKYAYRFSSVIKADLHILHVYDFPPINFSIIKPLESLKKSMHEEKIELVKKYCEKHLKHEFRQKPVTTHVVENNSVSESILRLSKILNPGLVMVGAKNGQNLRGILAENIANEVLNKIDIPVLIVPKGVIYDTLSTIIYATDFEKEDVLSIQKLIEIARPFEALIEIVHIYEIDKFPATEKMQAFKNTLLKQVSYPEITFRNIASDKIKSGLLSVLNNENANMLAMLERKHNWSFHNMFHKDLVKDMETTVSIPILAFNKHSKIKLQNANATHSESILAY